MNRTTFYAALRKRDSDLFGTALTEGQVRGIDAILDQAEQRGTPHRHLAYILATVYHEVGGRMLPVRESLNYSVQALLSKFGRHRISEADARLYGRTGPRPANQQMIANLIYGGEWGRANLGNTQPGDGWLFRGGGLVQITGRANFTKFGLASDPDRSADLVPAVRAAFNGMEHGLFTGHRLSDFTDYRQMRLIINGTDADDTIAGYAASFERALAASGYAPGKIVTEPRIRDVAFAVPGQETSPPAAEKTGSVVGPAAIGVALTAFFSAVAAYWDKIATWFGG